MPTESYAQNFIRSSWKKPDEVWGLPLTDSYKLPTIEILDWHAVGSAEDDNWVVTDRPIDKLSYEIAFRGRHNVLVIGHNCKFHGHISMHTDRKTVIFGENTGGNVNVFGSGVDGILFLGSKTTCTRASFFLLGDNTRIVVGEDCMFAHGIVVRTHDDHAMIDMENGALLNPPANIQIHPHVWICPDVLVLRGTNIGFGSIVGAKSLVNRDIAPLTLSAGAPNRTVKERVSWQRSPVPDRNAHHQIAQLFEKFNATHPK